MQFVENTFKNYYDVKNVVVYLEMLEHAEKKITMPLEGEMIKMPFFGKIKKSSEKYKKNNH